MPLQDAYLRTPSVDSGLVNLHDTTGSPSEDDLERGAIRFFGGCRSIVDLEILSIRHCWRRTS